jgi:uncharacterized ion transporter superfamily protein YfcC
MSFITKVKLPPTLLLIAGVLLIATIASELLPAGRYERVAQQYVVEGVAWADHTIQTGETTAAVTKEIQLRQATELGAGSGREPSVYTAMMSTMLAGSEPRNVDATAAADSPSSGTTIQVPILKTGSRSVVKRGTYAVTERAEAGSVIGMAQVILTRFLKAPLAGFERKADIIGFVLLIGGAFGVILATGAIDAGLRVTVARLEAMHVGWVTIPVVMVLFSIAGATFGMSEEVIPFVMITIPLALRLGYDSLTGLCMSFVAAGIGFAAALTNPFTIGIAQGIAGLAPFSGMEYRLLIWVLATSIGVVYTMSWAARVKKDPKRSPVYETDKDLIHAFTDSENESRPFSGRDAGVLLVLVVAVIVAGWGSMKYHWWMGEITAVFIAAALLSGLVGHLTMDRAVKAFSRGASELTPAALVIALSAGILVVLEQGQTLDTILYGIDRSLGDLPGPVGANLMYIFHQILNFFIPSGSGQAAVTMPLMAPLADLMGISRQTAVLAFQFGDGFNNMIIPTSAVTMSVLGIARLPWEKWAWWILPLQCIFIIFGFVMLTIAVLIGYQ